MATAPGNSEIARTIRFLMGRDEVNVHQLSVKTAIPASTLYAMLKKNSNEADIQHLKRIADTFGESISIFCGLDEYERPVEMTVDERRILSYYRQMNDEGRRRLLEYSIEVGENPRYVDQLAEIKKCDGPELLGAEDQ